MPRLVRVDIDGEDFGFHGSVSERVARAMLLAMTSEDVRQRGLESPQPLFAETDCEDAFLETLAGAERTLYVRARLRWGEPEGHQFVMEERDPKTWYRARLLRMRPFERPRFAELAAREGRASAIRAMHEALLERPT